MESISQLISMREPCLDLLDWQLLLDGQPLVGHNATLLRVAKAWKICKSNTEVVQNFHKSSSTDDDLSA
jgi:hypothetical protein